MFHAGPWAEAFIAGVSGGAEDAALEYLRVFCRAAHALPGDLSGGGRAERFSALARAALDRAGIGGAEAELARRFAALMIRRGCFYQHKRIILGIERLIRARKGRVDALVESAVEPDGELIARIEEKTRLLTGAREVSLDIRVVPSLIGGIRLRVGSLLFDGTLKYRLRKMAADLKAGSLNPFPASREL
ncbi:MAG: F0F1 ATP synthase subunit delta [Treponema sp.]|jgi:F-type H+-transporting ATPase subunit delta|nr:F0F1 ATP synthase subunit delta [Treponema sp.]